MWNPRVNCSEPEANGTGVRPPPTPAMNIVPRNVQNANGGPLQNYSENLVQRADVNSHCNGSNGNGPQYPPTLPNSQLMSGSGPTARPYIQNPIRRHAASFDPAPEYPQTLPYSQLMSGSSPTAMPYIQNPIRRHDVSFGPAPECPQTLPFSQVMSSSSPTAMPHTQNPIRSHGIRIGPVPGYPPTTAMPHTQNPIRSHGIRIGPAPAPARAPAPAPARAPAPAPAPDFSSVTSTSPSPSVPVSLINPVNPRASVESNHMDYIQRLLSLSPEELSKHAAELEKRSLELARAENREIQRMAALGIKLPHQPSRREQGPSDK